MFPTTPEEMIDKGFYDFKSLLSEGKNCLDTILVVSKA
jgi:hypothetical protein